LQAKNKAIVLLSGGLDSATVLAIAKQQGFTIHALSFDYGQRHKIELRAARRLAEAYGAQHSLIAFDLRQFGGSALTANIEVPKDRASHQISEGIPITYVPARNTIFLSFALGLAEVIGAVDIFVGVNALDYSGYPDCRPEFIAAFQQLANLATKAGVEGRRFAIHAPLIEMTKSQIIREGIKLGVDYALTTTCYDPSSEGQACGHCDSCQLRRKGFAEAGVPDPTRYQ
jgi:7-cyano-7-deazaguanine synthase